MSEPVYPFEGEESILHLFSTYDWLKESRDEIVNRHAVLYLKDVQRRHSMNRRIDGWRNLFDVLLKHPSEIFYEVLSHLHPLDLLHLSRTNKSFRALLMTRNICWLWDLAFTRHPGVPACPPDLPHPWWTELIFGPNICQDCDGRETVVHWDLRRRLCWDKCFYERVYTAAEFSTLPRRLDCCPPHIRNITTELQKLIDRVHAYENAPSLEPDVEWEARLLLEKLRADPETKVKIDAIKESADAGYNWSYDMDREIDAQAETLRCHAFDRLRKRLKASGHYKTDIERVMHRHPYLDFFGIDEVRPLKYIRRNWPALQVKLEALIAQYAREEAGAVLHSRKNTLNSLYRIHERNFSPSESRPDPYTLPPFLDLVLYDPFPALLASPDQFDSRAAPTVEEFVERWPALTVEELADSCPFFYMPSESSLGGGGASPRSSSSKLNVFVAGSVFSCLSCERRRGANHPASSQCLIGWSAAIRHRRGSHGLRGSSDLNSGALGISERGSAAIDALVDLLDLRLEDTYPVHLDRLRLQFWCLDCDGEEGDEVRLEERTRFRWRDLVSHFLDSHDGFTPSWKYLPSEIVLGFMETKNQDRAMIDEESLAFAADMLS